MNDEGHLNDACLSDEECPICERDYMFARILLDLWAMNGKHVHDSMSGYIKEKMDMMGIVYEEDDSTWSIHYGVN